MSNDYVCIDGIRFPIERETLEKVKALVCPKPLVRVGDVLRFEKGSGKPLRLIVEHPRAEGLLLAITQGGKSRNVGKPDAPFWKRDYTFLYNVFTGVDNEERNY